MLKDQRLLIIEDMFLIALDIQRIIEEANAPPPVLARTFEEAAGLAGQFGEFDLAIVNPPEAGSAGMNVAAQLAAVCPSIVVCTGAGNDLSATPLAGAELIMKPFSDDDLLAACRRAMDRRKN